MSEKCNNDCSSCSENCEKRAPQKEKPNEFSHIKKVIGVISGKGGVGKSLVTSLMACSAVKAGLKTAILDADVTGPSIPKAFGVTQRVYADERNLLIPATSAKGLQMISVNLLLQDESDPVVWRGPVIAGTVTQFFNEVNWGDVDLMLIDCPPGTGDVPLTVFQSLPIDGIVVVTSPQELVSMIVKKAVKMANIMEVPVLGIVENFSYFICPTCNDKHYIYGKSDIENIANENGIANIAKLPIDTELANYVDSGMVELYKGNNLDEFLSKVLQEAEK